jgi:hypothetical protein
MTHYHHRDFNDKAFADMVGQIDFRIVTRNRNQYLSIIARLGADADHTLTDYHVEVGLQRRYGRFEATIAWAGHLRADRRANGYYFAQSVYSRADLNRSNHFWVEEVNTRQFSTPFLPVRPVSQRIKTYYHGIGPLSKTF